MSQSVRSAESLSLLVRDSQGEYRLATSDEVLGAARHVLSRRVRRGTTLSSPDVVRDYLRTKLGNRTGKNSQPADSNERKSAVGCP